jgi:peptidoglycan/LPS O-acetylase OafA/YrhL
MEFTREKTNIAKGVAISLMFAHHLYPHGNRFLNGNSYIPLIPFFNAELYLGKVGNICVSMFLFLSGYGLFLGWSHSQQSPIRYSLAKLKDFYLTYWLYFAIFVPLGFIFFKDRTFWNSDQLRYSGDAITFLLNLCGWSATYNGEWWFVRVFIITLVFLFPIYIKLADKNIILMIFISFILLLLGLKADPWGPLGFLLWQVSFALGIICAKLKFFSSRPIQYLDNLGWVWVMLALLLCFTICFLFRRRFGGLEVKYDFFIVTLFIYFSVRAVVIVNLNKVFTYLGQYSFPLWLVHPFFCYYYFQDIVYFPKWSPFVFILLTTLSLLSIIGIDCAQKNIKDIVLRIKVRVFA